MLTKNYLFSFWEKSEESSISSENNDFKRTFERSDSNEEVEKSADKNDQDDYYDDENDDNFERGGKFDISKAVAFWYMTNKTLIFMKRSIQSMLFMIQ